MGFGKKKKKKSDPEKPVQSVRVDMQHNPLYPPKKESDLKEILSAAGTTVVSLILVGLIISKFSYANRMDAYAVNGTSGGGYYEETKDTGMEDAGTQNDEESYPGDVEERENTDDTDEENTDRMTADDREEEQEEEKEEKENKEYILADSNSRYISESDLANLSEQELSYARNEIYARHGRRFKDAGLQGYFDGKPWYSGTIEPDQFPESMLNEYEKKNAETILAYEKAKGYK